MKRPPNWTGIRLLASSVAFATPFARKISVSTFVLQKMRQGLCFFDGSKRLIVANTRYAELYGISPEAIRPGMGLREIVDLRFAAAACPR